MLLSKFVSQVDFNSYEEFSKSFKICIPDNFNFAYDVVDEIASATPEKVAIVWCNDKGEEAVFTFGQLKYYSDKTANFFKNAGIKRRSCNANFKRRYEFWFSILALHKLELYAYLLHTFLLQRYCLQKQCC